MAPVDLLSPPPFNATISSTTPLLQLATQSSAPSSTATLIIAATLFLLILLLLVAAEPLYRYAYTEMALVDEAAFSAVSEMMFAKLDDLSELDDVSDITDVSVSFVVSLHAIPIPTILFHFYTISDVELAPLGRQYPRSSRQHGMPSR